TAHQPEFLAKSEEYTYKLADNLLDAMTRGEHSKSLANTERSTSTSGDAKHSVRL
ncbi:hypothetical protein CRUP_004617, partial [Coryphaenoides rupestris]